MRRQPQQIVHQEVRWVPESRLVPISDDLSLVPYRVWTLYGSDSSDPSNPPSLPMTPVHNQGSFLEDRGHDWLILPGHRLLKYFSRVALHSTWILIEYVSVEKK